MPKRDGQVQQRLVPQTRATAGWWSPPISWTPTFGASQLLEPQRRPSRVPHSRGRSLQSSISLTNSQSPGRSVCRCSPTLTSRHSSASYSCRNLAIYPLWISVSPELGCVCPSPRPGSICSFLDLKLIGPDPSLSQTPLPLPSFAAGNLLMTSMYCPQQAASTCWTTFPTGHAARVWDHQLITTTVLLPYPIHP